MCILLINSDTERVWVSQEATSESQDGMILFGSRRRSNIHWRAINMVWVKAKVIFWVHKWYYVQDIYIGPD